jgi:hypothetical protein
MAIGITTTWHNAGPHTIWGKLAAKLGRKPTKAEAEAEVRRILDEARIERASSENLPHRRFGR